MIHPAVILTLEKLPQQHFVDIVAADRSETIRVYKVERFDEAHEGIAPTDILEDSGTDQIGVMRIKGFPQPERVTEVGAAVLQQNGGN